MSIGEIGGVSFLAVCTLFGLYLLVQALPGDTTRHR